MKKRLKHFQARTFLFLFSLFLLFACSHRIYQVNHVETQRFFITDSLEEKNDFNQLILPYKNKMSAELDRVLAYSPIDLELTGMNTTLGNFVTDLMLREGNLIYSQRHPNEKIDVVLMNRGGLRRTFTKGDISVRSMYELMPFENEAVVVTLSGPKFYDMVSFLRATPRNHPVSGLVFNKNTEDKEFTIGGEIFDENKRYRVLTNDYLQKGGDQMSFFLDPVEVEYLQWKLRDMFIHNLEKVDTIQVNTEARYLE